MDYLHNRTPRFWTTLLAGLFVNDIFAIWVAKTQILNPMASWTVFALVLVAAIVRWRHFVPEWIDAYWSL